VNKMSNAVHVSAFNPRLGFLAYALVACSTAINCTVCYCFIVCSFYRAMHLSAFAPSWDRMSSVCPSVSDIGDL